MITVSKTNIYWNYFLALENNLEIVSRYIEFMEANFNTYSIELASLLFAASSEVDVIMKELCGMLDPSNRVRNIDDYREIVKRHCPAFIDEPVNMPRYGLTLNPWSNWQVDVNPDWWKSYKNVKHERNIFFNEANLKNAINSLGALIITIFYYTRQKNKEFGMMAEISSAKRELQPKSKLFKLRAEYDLLM